MTFSDESHIGDHRYMVIGGIVCRPNHADEVRALVKRAQGRFPDVLKWERVRANNVHRYAQLVRDFFEFNQSQRVDFCALIIDTDLADHDRHNDGDEEMGFHKFMAQHLFRHCRVLGRQATFQSYYAQRASSRLLSEVQDALNNMARQHYRDSVRRYVELKYRRFKADRAFYLADVLIGAVGAAYNNTLTPGPKRELAELIRCEAGLDSLAQPTPPDRRNFDIWKFRMKA